MPTKYKRTGRAISWRATTESEFGTTHNHFRSAGGAYQYVRRMMALHPYVTRITILKLYRDSNDWIPAKTITREDA